MCIMDKRQACGKAPRGAEHSPALPRRACIFPAARVPSGSSEVQVLVWGLLTTLHTQQRWPPYLWKDGFSPCVMPLSFTNIKKARRLQCHPPMPHPSLCSDSQFCEPTLGLRTCQNNRPDNPTSSSVHETMITCWSCAAQQAPAIPPTPHGVSHCNPQCR